MGEQTENVELKEASDNNKRKLEASIELAKQKVQQIASRIINDAAATANDPKRPRIVSDPSFSDSTPTPSFPVPIAAPASQHYGLQGTSKRISIPSGKVGVVIGKGGETIKYIQLQSGGRIQITKDQDADPHSLTRDVELMGTSEQICRAEQLINDVIMETDAGGSASSAVHGLNAKQFGEEQFSMKVPNDRVGLLIGKGGETIKHMQSTSGARIQVAVLSTASSNAMTANICYISHEKSDVDMIIPLHLPPGDPPAERMVYINGSAEQIEAAKELVNEVVSGKRIITPSGPNTYPQQVYPPASNWAQPGQPPMQQQPQYGYTQSAPYYGNYSSQQQPWDQSATPQPPQEATGYGYYGQQPQMGYSYSQMPVGSNTYDQAYSHHQLSYGQNISSHAAAAAYGQTTLPSQPDGAISTQSTQPAPSYPPPSYSQSMTNPQTYWTSSSFPGQPSAQTAYDQTGCSQTAYGGQQSSQVPPPSSQPVYGQGGYPLHPTSAAANYSQGTHPYYVQPYVEAETQSQPPSNGLSQ
ncbi:unnamed protein product [Dovyalis caffra]|uniref:K Homology domain-containing protein n=1 Tax=Dovyalis caffra TaxID=77055 RepID=A0AAV1SVY2_9ROSI|nr:unnamed protein product [Dovyalis caffra]